MAKLSRLGLLIGSFFWSGISYAYPTAYTMSFLGVPAGAEGYGVTSINDAGQMVGSTTTSANGGNQIATLWNGMMATYLDTPIGKNSYATSINNAGKVAGTTMSNDYSVSEATLWDKSITTYLNTPVGGSSFGYGINDTGKIIGKTTRDQIVGSKSYRYCLEWFNSDAAWYDAS